MLGQRFRAEVENYDIFPGGRGRQPGPQIEPPSSRAIWTAGIDQECSAILIHAPTEPVLGDDVLPSAIHCSGRLRPVPRSMMRRRKTLMSQSSLIARPVSVIISPDRAVVGPRRQNVRQSVMQERFRKADRPLGWVDSRQQAVQRVENFPDRREGRGQCDCGCPREDRRFDLYGDRLADDLDCFATAPNFLG